MPRPKASSSKQAAPVTKLRERWEHSNRTAAELILENPAAYSAIQQAWAMAFIERDAKEAPPNDRLFKM